MRITSFRSRPFSLALRRPLPTAAGVVDCRRGRVLLLGDESGRVGLGEVSPLPGFSPESLEEAWASLEEFSLPPLPEEASALAGLIESLALPPSASFGLEMAALDLIGQRQGRPLAHLLSEEAQDWVPLSQLVQDLAGARAAVNEGVGTLKIKVGHRPMAETGALLESIREALGPEIRLRLDANRAWSPAEATACLSQWRRLEIECVEEPLRSDCLDQLSKLGELGVPLAADESLRSPSDLAQLSAAFAGVVLKPLLIGGLHRSVMMAREAATRGLFVLVTTSLEAAVGRLGVAHVAAACPREAQRAHGLGTGILLGEDLVEGPADPGIQRGRYQLSSSPGLGLTLGQLRTGEAA